jgi:hypothetical protein
VNNGNITQPEGDNALQINDGSSVVNAAKGVYVMAGDVYIETTSGATGTFANAGLFRKSQGTSQFGASITTAFNNTGLLEVQSGILAISGPIAQFSGGTLTGGSWSVFGTTKTSSTLDFSFHPNLTTIGTKASVTLSGPHSAFTNLAGLTTDDGSFSLLGGQSFAASGSFTNAGKLTLSPGSTLSVNGNYTQTAAGKLTIQMGGKSTSPTIGSISATGAVTLAGSLSLTDSVNVIPAVGTVFIVLDNLGKSAISGVFAGLAGGSTIKVTVGSTTMTFTISYKGGPHGNSVALTRTS